MALSGWHPVAAAGAVSDRPVAGRLGEREIVLWRDAHGAVHAADDRCPHRGTRLSLGAVRHVAGECRLECPYHGWQFDGAGRCRAVPALPDFVPPPSYALAVHGTREALGLVWANVGGETDAEPRIKTHDSALAIPELGAVPARLVVCGPYDVQTSAPRIVENFLDVSHFAFVHEGLLGDRAQAHVPEHDVVLDADGAPGVAVYRAWQPLATALATGGAWVRYRYQVLGPYSAVLHKLADDASGAAPGLEGSDAIAIWVAPLGAEASRVWITLHTDDRATSDADLRAFQDRIFLQDLPILESQRPRVVPLEGGELHSAADRLSLAYRRYLQRLSRSP